MTSSDRTFMALRFREGGHEYAIAALDVAGVDSDTTRAISLARLLGVDATSTAFDAPRILTVADGDSTVHLKVTPPIELVAIHLDQVMPNSADASGPFGRAFIRENEQAVLWLDASALVGAANRTAHEHSPAPGSRETVRTPEESP